MATSELQPACQFNCKCSPTHWASLPLDLLRASLCLVCIYRLFSSCPQTALHICRNSKLVPRSQHGPWCITFSSVNSLTLAATLILQEYWAASFWIRSEQGGRDCGLVSRNTVWMSVCFDVICFCPRPMMKKKDLPVLDWPKTKARGVAQQA